MRQCLLLGIPLVLALGSATPGWCQQSLLEERMEVRHDEAMFTVWAWITVADTTGSHTGGWSPVKRHVQQAVLDRLSPAYLDTLRRAYYEQEPDPDFHYQITVLALLLTQPPDMRISRDMMEREKEWARSHGRERYLSNLKDKEAQAAELLPLLNAFHSRAELGQLYEECRRWYDPAVAAYKDGTIGRVREALDYLGMDESVLAPISHMVLIPNLIGPLGSAMSPGFEGVTFTVESPMEDAAERPINFTAHEQIHFMVWDLTRGERYRQRIEGITARVWDDAEGSPARGAYGDMVTYFDENLVRVITSAAMGIFEGVDPWDPDAAGISAHEQRGFLLLRPLLAALQRFEGSGESFDTYFPTFLDDVERAMAARSPTVPSSPRLLDTIGRGVVVPRTSRR